MAHSLMGVLFSVTKSAKMDFMLTSCYLDEYFMMVSNVFIIWNLILFIPLIRSCPALNHGESILCIPKELVNIL